MFKEGGMDDHAERLSQELIANPGIKICRSLDAYRQLSVKDENNKPYSGDSPEAVRIKLNEFETGNKEFCGFLAGRDNEGRELLSLPGIYFPESNQVIVVMDESAKRKATRVYFTDNGAGGGKSKEINSLSELSPIFASEINFRANVSDIKRILIREDVDRQKKRL